MSNQIPCGKINAINMLFTKSGLKIRIWVKCVILVTILLKSIDLLMLGPYKII